MYKLIWSLILITLVPLLAFTENLTPTTMHKLSADLRAVVTEVSPLKADQVQPHLAQVQTVTSRDGETLYPVTIRSNDIEAVKAAGIKTNSDFPNFSTARVTKDELLKLAEIGAVTSVFQGDVLYPHNDLAVGLAGADLVHDGYLNSTAYDGTDVIVLIIDTGIDFTHLDFRDPSTPDTSRILRIWDQTLTAGVGEQTPQGRDNTNFNGLNYGVEYIKSEIEGDLDGTTSNFVRQTDTNGHGTEITGAAAGNGASLSNKKYTGMAPDADIVMVKAGTNSFLDSNIKDALTYAEKLSAKLNKPVVVNMSLGSQSNAHDGTSTLAEAVDNFTSSGNGRVAVVSAGNAGNEDIHVTGTVANGATGSITITVPSYSNSAGANNDYFYFELWWNSSGSITSKVISPNGYYNEKSPASANTVATDDGAIYSYNHTDSDHSNGDRMNYVRVRDDTEDVGPEPGTWTIEVTNNSGSTMTYHGWLFASSMGATVTGGNANSTIASPGSASSAITVGAYTPRWRWRSTAGYVNFGTPDESDDISYFSSKGPNREGGVQKPDVLTPGQGVITTTSTDYTPSSTYEIEADKYHLEQGTSVAAGTVSGAVALLLDYNSALSASAVRTLLRDHADSDSYTGSVPNDEWGYGKLNIMEALADEIGGSTTLYHKTYSHDSWGSSSFHNIDVNVKEAVKFTATNSGEVTGAFFHAHQTIPASGSISFEIWTNSSGLPHTKVGTTVTMNCTDIAKNTWNYVSLEGVNVNVLATETFHLVLRNTSGSIISLTEGSSSISNNSSNDLGVGWAALTDRDWRMRVIVSNNAEVTETSLPVVLSFFNAGTHKGQMVLKWATESETENQGFRIDRRKSGSDEWKFIADHTKYPSLRGQGNSTSRTDYIFYDKSAKPGVKYDYRLTDIPYSPVYKANSYVLEDVEFRIEKFTLHDNYPNPFNPATTISYELANQTDVQIRIVDVNGREVGSWSYNGQEQGYHEMTWAGLDATGKPVSAGLYLLNVRAGNQVQSRKLLLLK